MDALSMIWWGSTIVAIVAVAVGVAVPIRRRQALVVAAVLFMVAGVLGILSIGIIFVLAAVACGVIAARNPRADLAPDA